MLWLVALAIDYAAPFVLYRVPGRPSSSPSAWDVETSHFAERFQLFIIIALGESIVVTGATTSQLSLGAARLAAFGLAFLMTAAFWWLYFSYVAAIAQRRLELADDRTTMARDGYTYLHVVLVAGIIVSAVGDEIVIRIPRRRCSTAELVAVVAGPVIYLLGHVLFRLVMAGSLSASGSAAPSPASQSASSARRSRARRGDAARGRPRRDHRRGARVRRAAAAARRAVADAAARGVGATEPSARRAG